MNTKDYKRIAEIFKDDDKGIISNSRQEKNTLKRIALKLADYFEKESKPTTYKYSDGKPIKEFDSFMRAKFLKDCGVE